ncbi:MAG: PKD domain-containing protein [Candidatus Hodarchaeota archaeon]
MKHKRFGLYLWVGAMIVIFSFQTSIPLIQGYIDSLIDFEVEVEDRIYDVHEEVPFKLIMKTGGFNKLIWNFHDGSPIEETNCDEIEMSHSFANEGEYLISITGVSINSRGLAIYKLQTAQINIRNNPPIVDLPTGTKKVWEDLATTFEFHSVVDSAVDEPNLKYLWKFGDGNSAYGSTVTHTYTEAGEYLVALYVEDDQGQIGVDTMDVLVQNIVPEIQITSNLPSSNEVIEDTEIQFDATGTSDSISDVGSLEFFWDFGDGTYGTGSMVSHFYMNTGIYTATLTVKDHSDGISTESIDIQVVNTAPEIETIIGSDLSYPEGQTAILKVITQDVPSDVPRVTYQWALANNMVDGPSTTITEFDEGTVDYSLSLLDDNGASSVHTSQIEFYNVAPSASIVEATFGIESIEFNVTGRKWGSLQFLIINELNQTTLNETVEYDRNSETSNQLFTFYDFNLPINHSWRVEVKYYPITKYNWWYFYGNTPIEVNINFTNGLSLTFNHTFNIHHRAFHRYWKYSYSNSWGFWLDPFELKLPVTWKIWYYDPGTDTVTITLNNNQSTQVTIPAPETGPNQGLVTLTMAVDNDKHNPILLSIVDEDEAESYTLYWIDGPIIFDRFEYLVQQLLNLISCIGEHISPILELLPLDFSANITLMYTNLYTGEKKNVTYQIMFGAEQPFTITGPELNETTLIDDYVLKNVSISILIQLCHTTKTWTIEKVLPPPEWLGDPIKIIQGAHLTSFAPRIEGIQVDLPITRDWFWEDESVGFSVIGADLHEDPDVMYIWNFGDGHSRVTTAPEVEHQYTVEGIYLAEVTMFAQGFVTVCGGIIQIQNKAPEVPDAFLNLETEIVVGEPVALNASFVEDTPTDKETLRYWWDFQDGDQYTGYEEEVLHTFYQSGDYIVCITILDDNAASVSFNILVHVVIPAPVIILDDKYTGKDHLNTLMQAEVAGNAFQQANLNYEWTIGPTFSCISKRWTHLFNDGDYSGVLTVTNKEGGSASSLFTLSISNEIPVLNNVTHVVYGQKSTAYDLLITTLDSALDYSELESQLPNQPWVATSGPDISILLDLSDLNDGQHLIPINIRDATEEGASDFILIILYGDADGDSLLDTQEELIGTNPNEPDTDFDSILDKFEAAQDSITDPVVNDTDGDGLMDGVDPQTGYGEFIFETDPLDNDTDDDTLLDGLEGIGWQITVFKGNQELTYHVTSDPLVNDTDNDELSDAEEYYLGADPRLSDTDGDGLDDSTERQLGTAIANDDTDEDGLSDYLENQGYTISWMTLSDSDVPVLNSRRVYTDPWRSDTDSDGIFDQKEYNKGMDGANKDTDNDYLLDNEELTRSTDPNHADTDGDTLIDGAEVNGWNITIHDPEDVVYDAEGELLSAEPDVSSIERYIQTDPTSEDTDNDSIPDNEELLSKTTPSDPTLKDSDGDGIEDSEDAIPLIVDCKAPELTTNLSIFYTIDPQNQVDEVLEEIQSTDYSALSELLSNPFNWVDLLWDEIKDNLDGTGDYTDTCSSKIKDLAKEYIEEAYIEHDWDWKKDNFNDYGLSVSIDSFSTSKTTETIIKTIDFAIGNLIRIEDLWNIVGNLFVDVLAYFLSHPWPWQWGGCLNKLAEAFDEAFDKMIDLVMDTIDIWVNEFISDNGLLNPSWWLSGFDLDITWRMDPVFKIIPIGIKSIDLGGVINIVHDIINIIGVATYTIGGEFAAQFKKVLTTIIDIFTPDVQIDFTAVDEAGIDNISLWVNDDLKAIERYYGATTAEFSYLIETFSDIHADPTTDMVTGDPLEGQINGFDIRIEILDINGNIRRIEEYKEGFGITLLGLVAQILEEIIEVIQDTFEYIVTTIFRLGEAVAEAAEVVVETAIQVAEVIVEVVAAAIEFVWEGIVMSVLQAYKDLFLNPAQDITNLVCDYGVTNSETIQSSIFDTIQNIEVNNTLNLIDDQIQNIVTIITPLADIASGVSSFVKTLTENLLAFIPGGSIVLEALQKLSELAFEIISKILNEIIEGIVYSLINQYLKPIALLLECLIGNSFNSFIQTMQTLDLFGGVSPPDGSIEELDLSNGLSFIPIILNLLTSFPSVTDLYNHGINGFEQFITEINLLNLFLSGDRNNVFSGRGLINLLIPPLLSIGLAVIGLFNLKGGLTLDILNNIFQIGFSSNNKLNTVFKISSIDGLNSQLIYAEDIVSILNWIILFFGIVMESINTIRESLPKEVEYLKIYFSGTLFIIASVDLIFANFKELIQSQFVENRGFNITWAIQKTIILFVSHLSRLFRDATVYIPISTSTKNYLKSILYLISGLMNIVKIVLALIKADQEELDELEQIGILASLLEDVIKVGFSFLKASKETSEYFTMPDNPYSLFVTGLLNKYEVMIRLFLIPVDFVEDFFLFQYSESKSPYPIPIIPIIFNIIPMLNDLKQALE